MNNNHIHESARASLEATLANRRRKLVEIYQDHQMRTWAVSRPLGQRSARYDQRHLLNSQGGIVHTEGAPDYAPAVKRR